jgi:hypothetical protein
MMGRRCASGEKEKEREFHEREESDKTRITARIRVLTIRPSSPHKQVDNVSATSRYVFPSLFRLPFNPCGFGMDEETDDFVEGFAEGAFGPCAGGKEARMELEYEYSCLVL